MVNDQSQRSTIRVDVAVMWSKADVALPEGDMWHCVDRHARVVHEEKRVRHLIGPIFARLS